MKREGGSASVVLVLLLPVVALVLASVVDLGLLRLASARVRAAADLAAVVAVNDQVEPAPGAPLRLSPDAEAVARDHFALALSGIAPLLAGDAQAIAGAADIAAFPAGGVDPRDGTPYDRPAVRIAAAVPLRSGSLRPIVGPTVVVRALAVAAAR